MKIGYFKVAMSGAVMALGMTALSANAYTLNSGMTDVGNLDTYVDETTQAALGSSSPTAEEMWVEDVLGFDVTYETKTEGVEFGLVDGSDSIVAFGLVSMPTYFVVKDSTIFKLFQNVDSLDWGVLDLATHFGVDKLDTLQLSHVTEFDSDDVPVPEPGSLALLGLGLVGLHFARRKKA